MSAEDQDLIGRRPTHDLLVVSTTGVERSLRRRKHPVAFSLLEVIIATAVIAASSMVLLRLISTGAQHQQRAERHAMGQLICQTLIDEMLVGITPLDAADEQRVADNPDWTYTTQIEPTEYPGIVRVRIEAALSPVDAQRTRADGAFDYELVRWLRAPQDQPEMEDTP